MKPILASILLFACMARAYAQQPDYTQLRAGVWERILARLETLPERWNDLPAPTVPPSGRSAEDVFKFATDTERRSALELISRLKRAVPAERVKILAQTRQQRMIFEIDLWIPLFLTNTEHTRDLDAAGITIECWLAMAEQLGRRDVLLRAAGAALYLAQFRVPPSRLLAAATGWSILPPGPHSSHGAASVNKAYADIRFRIGHNREALDAYRRARLLYRDVGDKLGMGISWQGEATVLFHLGQNQKALRAYRQAHTLFREVGDELGRANSLLGEADVLFRLGQSQKALRAYRQARALHQDVGNEPGQGYSWLGEARVLFRLGKNQEALSAFWCSGSDEA